MSGRSAVHVGKDYSRLDTDDRPWLVCSFTRHGRSVSQQRESWRVKIKRAEKAQAAFNRSVFVCSFIYIFIFAPFIWPITVLLGTSHKENLQLLLAVLLFVY